MSLVTASRYRTVTIDTVSSELAITGALVTAQELLEEDLGRPLESAQRTERVYPNRRGQLFPIVTPVTVVPSGYQIDGTLVYGTGPTTGDFLLDGVDPYVDLIYTGGFVERTVNPTATNRLPAHIETDVCWAAHRALHPASTPIPVGATSVRLGDAGVGYGPSGAPQGADVGAPWSKATLRYRRPGRRV